MFHMVSGIEYLGYVLEKGLCPTFSVLISRVARTVGACWVPTQGTV